MERSASRIIRACALSSLAVIAPQALAGAARAQDQMAFPPAEDQRLRLLEEQLKGQQAEIESLKQRLEQQDAALAIIRGRGLTDSAPADAPPPSAGASPPPPESPVGEAPSSESQGEQLRAHVQAVPEGQGVLTPRGTLTIEPSVEYVSSSSNRLVFRGVELVPGLQLGVIEASTADRNTVVATGTLRYGLSSQLEAEVRVPFVYRHDRIQVVQQREQGIVRSLTFDDSNIGDVEFALRYQLNRPKGPQQPIFVASVRAKSNTGRGPFDVGYDEFGIATGLATGSGFWAVQPGLNILLPSDPVVIYGGVSYLINIGRDVNRTVGGAFVGHVSPGNAVSGNLGFGFALNPRFSFSLGYEHSYIFPTRTEIGTTIQKSSRLQVGALVLGMSYRVAEKQTINWNFEFGVTQDAPDVAITLRVPINIAL